MPTITSAAYLLASPFTRPGGVRRISLAVMLILLVWGCAPPAGQATQPEPRQVVQTYLDAQRSGNSDLALQQWGFTSDAFQEYGGVDAAAAIKADVQRKAAAHEPQVYRLGETAPSTQHADRAFVEVWWTSTGDGMASHYELVRLAEGWKIIAFIPAPTPPRREPEDRGQTPDTPPDLGSRLHEDGGCS